MKKSGNNRLPRTVDERKLRLLEARITGGSPYNSLDSAPSLTGGDYNSPSSIVARGFGLDLVNVAAEGEGNDSQPPPGAVVSFGFSAVPREQNRVLPVLETVVEKAPPSTSSTEIDDTLDEGLSSNSHGARSSLKFSPQVHPQDGGGDPNGGEFKASPAPCGIPSGKHSGGHGANSTVQTDGSAGGSGQKRTYNKTSPAWYAQKRPRARPHDHHHTLSPQKVGELPGKLKSPTDDYSPLNKEKDPKPQSTTILSFFTKEEKQGGGLVGGHSRWPEPFQRHGSIPDLQTTTENTPPQKNSQPVVTRQKRGRQSNIPEEVEKKVKSLEEQVASLKAELAQSRAGRATAESIVTSLRQQLDAEQAQRQAMKEEIEARASRTAAVLRELLHKVAQQESRDLRMKMAQDSVRLGRMVTVPSGHKTRETWEEGYATKDLKRKQSELLALKEDLDKRRKALAREVRKAQKEKMGKEKEEKKEEKESNDGGEVLDEFDLLGQEEALKLRLNQVKREETRLNEERKALELIKRQHMKELKRVQLEDRSRFSKLAQRFLHQRYYLMSLLGKGGFSEVWKGYDLHDLKEVAIKVHQLNMNWTEDRKQNYIKHATREYAIHSDMEHPRVVRLFDVFEINSNAFATVLEFCKGTDLEHHLQTHQTLAEKDARAIVVQILHGLRYLNTPTGEGEDRRRGIIHYDLKPGNILFDENGEVKITDFGLSKIVDDSCEGTSMELTSQGAGTYWYLPPECFVVGTTPPRISSKVDVWSVGVIFYQMLFGRRPFGDGQDPGLILSHNTILQATKVEFPSKPTISNEAKEFIRTCLSHNQADRPDVPTICKHSYLRQKKI